MPSSFYLFPKSDFTIKKLEIAENYRFKRAHNNNSKYQIKVRSRKNIFFLKYPDLPPNCILQKKHAPIGVGVFFVENSKLE